MKLRNRQIHPEFFQDEKVSALPPLTRLLFIGLWCLADKEGRLEYNPPVIRGLLFPFEPRIDVEKMLRELHKSEMAEQYEVENRRYIQIRNFIRYQKVHPNEAQSVIPMSLNLITLNDGDTITKGKGRGKGKGEDIPFEEIVNDLNSVIGSNYLHTTEATRKLIRARWNEGFRLNDFKRVHANMKKWKGDPDMEQYLRPQTLYAGKFEGYLNQRPKEQIEAGEKWNRTATCPECGNIGPIVEWPREIEPAKKATGKIPIMINGTVSMQCVKCEHKWNL